MLYPLSYHSTIRGVAFLWRANGERYRLVGGTRERHFAGTNSKPRTLPENAPTPTSRVHAVLARLLLSPY